MSKAIENFTIRRATEGYLIRIETEEGETAEFTADYDLLELIGGEIDALLEEGEDESYSTDDDEDETLDRDDD